jgi:Rrf2 family protein
MLRVARQTDYAARIVAHLASLGPGEQASIAEVAADRLLPVPFVRRIVGRLVAADIVATVRGQKGGIRLARPAARISLLDVVRAMEGEADLSECLESPRTCPFSSKCPVRTAWGAAALALERSLARSRFDKLGLAAPGHARAHARRPKPSR